MCVSPRRKTRDAPAAVDMIGDDEMARLLWELVMAGALVVLLGTRGELQFERVADDSSGPRVATATVRGAQKRPLSADTQAEVRERMRRALEEYDRVLCVSLGVGCGGGGGGSNRSGGGNEGSASIVGDGGGGGGGASASATSRYATRESVRGARVRDANGALSGEWGEFTWVIM